MALVFCSRRCGGTCDVVWAQSGKKGKKGSFTSLDLILIRQRRWKENIVRNTAVVPMVVWNGVYTCRGWERVVAPTTETRMGTRK